MAVLVDPDGFNRRAGFVTVYAAAVWSVVATARLEK
jgi:hypothetical protein